MSCSVVIAARNAEATLAEALESLLAQTLPDWEAIVVDDGSTDGTPGLIAALAVRDRRIRPLAQAGAGKSAARNRGIRAARFPWLLILDADDWLLPEALDAFRGKRQARPEADAVCGEWAWVDAGGRRSASRPPPGFPEVFPALARGRVFAIHACQVRTAIVRAAGGFDEDLVCAEDIDLWQRLARSGAVFEPMGRLVALARLRPGSASLDAPRMLADGLAVIGRGHGPDPRVPRAAPALSDGLPAEGLAGARLGWATSVAGLLAGRGEDATVVLAAVAGDRDPGLDAHGIAESLYEAGAVANSALADRWPHFWPAAAPRLAAFLAALETQSGTPRLARRVMLHLEQLVAAGWEGERPLQVGRTLSIAIEASEPAGHVLAEPGTERLHGRITVLGRAIGDVLLPVADGVVPAGVLADAVADLYAWPILGAFLARSVHPGLRIEPGPPQSIWRGDLRLASDTHVAAGDGVALHDAVGWTLFLQEVWGRPDWPDGRFYDPWPEPPADPRGGEGAPAATQVEVSSDLADLPAAGASLQAEASVAGCPLARVVVEARDGVVSAQALLAAITVEAGFELCRAVVREALLGIAWTDPAGLRERLARLARARSAGGGMPPGWEGAASAPAMLLGRRRDGLLGTSALRRAALPRAAADALLAAAEAAGDPVAGGSPRDGAALIAYVPEIIAAGAPPARDRREDPGGAAIAYDRHYFETIFLEGRDPWNYTTRFEDLKYAQTLSLLPRRRAGRALELACAEGHFTVKLGPHVRSLLAADISEVALGRARARCGHLANVSFTRLDLGRDPLPGPFDLIVCSEVLYFLDTEGALLEFARKVLDALVPGGSLIAAHCHQLVDDPAAPGFDWGLPFGAKRIGEILGSVLRLDEQVVTPAYRVQRWRAGAPSWRERTRRWLGYAEVATRGGDYDLPVGEAGRAFLPAGRTPALPAATPPAGTDRLPILMYHSVADEGPPSHGRYRVTPARFEEQLRYLRQAGFGPARLDEWRRAGERRRPLPGRRVLITFDDGYRDFHRIAWPLLRRYGFSALMFIVTDRVGATSDWDGEAALPLMDWDEIRQIAASGEVELGSHTATHPHLTGLDLADAVAELAASRAALTKETGRVPTAFAYPFGDHDPALRSVVGACGFTYGLSCRAGTAGGRDPLLALPRIEVRGGDDMAAFVRRLAGG